MGVPLLAGEITPEQVRESDQPGVIYFAGSICYHHPCFMCGSPSTWLQRLGVRPEALLLCQISLSRVLFAGVASVLLSVKHRDDGGVGMNWSRFLVFAMVVAIILTAVLVQV